MNAFLESWVKKAEEVGASDIRVMPGKVVTYRVKGDLTRVDEKIVTDAMLANILVDIDADEVKLDREGAVDVGLEVSESRIRLQAFKALSGICLSIRLIPKEIPLFGDLHLPDVVKTFADLSQGLVIVSGATGSGKSTTLASMIEDLNNRKAKNIMTVEDPIEYVYADKMSTIEQRQLGEHVKSFDDSIVQAMRQDPDIILVGELRDLDTIQSALRMAETGHLVFGTLHTRGAAESFSRIIDVFPEGQQSQVRVQLANVIQGIVSQQLIKTAEGKRLPLVEVLVANSTVRGTVRNPNGNLSTLKDAIQSSHTSLGSQTFYQSAGAHIEAGRMSGSDAKRVLSEEEVNSLRSYMKG